MKLDLEKLKAFAEAATPGPWYHCQPYLTVPPERTIHGYVEGCRVDFVSTTNAPVHKQIIISMPGREISTKSNDMAFIAAANPSTVLELIAEIERLRKDSQRLDWLQEQAEIGCVTMCFEIDGGFHVTLDPAGDEQKAAREVDTVRDGIDKLMS